MRTSLAVLSQWCLWLLAVGAGKTAGQTTEQGPGAIAAAKKKKKEQGKKAIHMPPGISMRIVGGERVGTFNTLGLPERAI